MSLGLRTRLAIARHAIVEHRSDARWIARISHFARIFRLRLAIREQRALLNHLQLVTEISTDTITELLARLDAVDRRIAQLRGQP